MQVGGEQWRHRMEPEAAMQGKRFMLVAGSIILFLAAFVQNARAHDEPVKGSLIGAGIGAAVGGPPGAAVGAVIGAAIGSHVAHESDHGAAAHAHAHRHAVRREVRHYEREPVAYARPARHAYANGDGAACEAKSRVVYVEKPRSVARTKVTKRVCRDVVVRQHVAMR
jgi:hypothetical protein